MNPQIAPAAMPAIAMTGMNSQRAVSAGRTGASTIALAPNAPIMNCPSAPMFHNFIRNAIEQASAAKMIGVAFTIVSESTPISPKDARAMCTYDKSGSPPTNAMMMPPNIKATTIAPKETAVGNHPAGSSSLGSSLTRQAARRPFTTDSVICVDSLFLDLMDLVQRCARHHQPYRLDLTLL